MFGAFIHQLINKQQDTSRSWMVIFKLTLKQIPSNEQNVEISYSSIKENSLQVI